MALAPPPPGTYEAGIDTARFLYRLHHPAQQAGALAMFGRPAKLPVSRLTAGYMADRELLWVEGRPSTVGSPDSLELLHPAALPDAELAVRRLVADVGLTDARHHAVSRLDVTASIALDTPSAGWAVLRGMAALDVPRRKPEVIGRPPETVYWLTERGERRERAYDKGLQLRVAPAGTRVRLEAQTRPRGVARTTAGWFTMERVRETFQDRFGAMARAADGLHVASEHTIREQLRELVEAEKVTPRQAELLIGHLGAESVGIPTPRRTRFRRRAELRRLGLAQALDGQDDVDVDLGAVLADALTAEPWRG